MKIPSRTRTRTSGPLGRFSTGFAAELREEGYAASSIGRHLRLMDQLSRWLAAEGLELDALGPRELVRFLRSRQAAGYTDHVTQKGVNPIVAHLRGLGVVPPATAIAPDGPVASLLEHYRDHLTVDRALGGQTARNYIDAVRPFLDGRVCPDARSLDLDQLGAADVRAFMVARCPTQSRGAARATATALRSLLTFLHVEGVISRPLVAAVPSVAGWTNAGLPKGLTAAELRDLLRSCDRRTRSGRRDFAILKLLSRLGLRVSEIAALLLDDIDWRSGTLIVHGKGDRSDRLPVPADVGEAVAAYLRRGRCARANERSVFVRIKAPHRSLTSGGVGQVVTAAARRAGLEHIHAHRLRHTAATQMLRSGASLPEIGQVLRHRRVLTTAIYAKVDRDALRTIARPWPGGVA